MPKCPKHVRTKNWHFLYQAPFFLHEVTSGAGAVGGDEALPPRTHGIRGITTSAAVFGELVGLYSVRDDSLEIEFNFFLFILRILNIFSMTVIPWVLLWL